MKANDSITRFSSVLLGTISIFVASNPLMALAMPPFFNGDGSRVKRGDDRQLPPFLDRDRDRYSDRDRPPFLDRDRDYYSDRDRPPFLDRDRDYYSDRGRPPFLDRDRDYYSDRDRPPFLKY
jgi:hypothetical protein